MFEGFYLFSKGGRSPPLQRLFDHFGCLFQHGINAVYIGTSSLGQITDEFLRGRFRWRYLNAPVYILAIGAILHTMSAFFLDIAALVTLATVLTAGTLLSIVSTLTIAVVESQRRKTRGTQA